MTKKDEHPTEQTAKIQNTYEPLIPVGTFEAFIINL